MDEMKLQQLDAEVAVEAEETVPALASETDDELQKELLLADIRLLEEKEAVITQKLCLAKEKCMMAQADQCRTLLQRIVHERLRKKEELKEVEARIREAEAKRKMEELSVEIEELTESIESEIFGRNVDGEEITPVFEPEYDHWAKSKRLSVVAKAFAWVGVLAGLIGGIIYMLLVENAYFPFSWVEFAIFGGVALAMIIIGICFGAASNRQKRIAKAIDEELAQKKAAYEAELLERARLEAEANAAWKNDNVDAVAAANEIEKKGDAKLTRKRALQSLIPDLSDKEDVKNKLHKIAPIVAAAAAVAAVAAVSSGKKRAAAKKNAAIREEFFKWLT